jgi:hypothetical protein
MENYIKNTGAKICVSCNDPEKKQVPSQNITGMFVTYFDYEGAVH